MPKGRKLLGYSLTLLVLILVALGLWQRQTLFDWWRLRGYQPPQAITALAQEDTMTPYARHLFYVYHAELDDKTTFGNHCNNEEQSIVLGCYVNGLGIYIYHVTDPRLKGVEEVTGAHEMLHAAYARLSISERKRVDKLINDQYATVTDPRIRGNIEDYRKNGADVTNELHSILGTEVSSLSPQLEVYYKQYFDDRQAIVGFSEKYEGVFVQLKDQAANLKSQIDQLDSQIHSLEASLQTTYDQLGAQKAAMDNLKTSGQYDAYNAQVGSYNAAVNRYNNDRARYEQLIAKRNGLADTYNRTALEEQSLVKAIDSRTTPQTVQ